MLGIEDTSTSYLLGARDCYIPGDPLSYTGTLAVVTRGMECLNWTDPRAVDTLARGTSNPVFPETDIANAANYCRDPVAFGKPWCATAAGGLLCDVPICPPEGMYSNEVSVYDNTSHTYKLSILKYIYQYRRQNIYSQKLDPENALLMYLIKAISIQL